MISENKDLVAAMTIPGASVVPSAPSREEVMKLFPQFPWLAGLEPLAESIVDTLFDKEAAYQGSWQKRGGIGAFMMLARKWDRIENMSREKGFDVIRAIMINEGDLEDDVRDLVGYCLLVLAEGIRQRAEG